LPDGLTEAFQFEAALAMAMNPDAFMDDKNMTFAEAAELIEDLADADDQETADAKRAQLGLMSLEELNKYRANEYSAEKERLNDGVSSRAFLRVNEIVVESDKFPGWDAVTAMQQVTGRVWDGSVIVFPVSSYQEIVDLAASDAFAGGLFIDPYLEESMTPLSDAEWETQIAVDIDVDANDVYDIGPKLVLEVHPHASETRVIEETPSGQTRVLTNIKRATFRAQPNVCVDVELCTAWTPFPGEPALTDIEQWVQAVDAHNSPQKFHRLIHGLRLTSRPASVDGERVDALRSIDLRQAQIIEDPVWPQIRKVSLDQLDLGLGANATETLLNHGGEEVGTRQEVWGDTSNRRTDLCVTYRKPEGYWTVLPLVAYGICRIAPLVDDPYRLEVYEPEAGVDDVLLPSDLSSVVEDSMVDAATKSVPLPPLSLALRMEKGNGWTWAPDCGYWACHERQPWRRVASPFATLNSALFGPTGAKALLHESEKLSGQIKKFGVARAAVIRVGPTALITDGSSIVAVPWDQIRQIDKGVRPAAVLEIIRTHPSPTALSDYADEEYAVGSFTAKNSRVSQMLVLCGQAMPLWDSKFKGYSLEAEPQAPKLATEINELRNELARDCLASLQRANELAQELRLLESPNAKQGIQRWRSSTWIDFMFAQDKSGLPIDYDKLGNSPRGANLFRIWFTAAGFGVGVRPGLNRNHTSSDQLYAVLPDRYADLEPNAQGPEDQHLYNLVGVRGRTNRYFATWSTDLQISDDVFIESVLSVWEEIGPTLSKYRN
jgi:hypothetical protein